MTFSPHARTALTVILGLGVMLAGCDPMDIEINGQKGVPFSDIEIAGPPPSEVVLSSGDTVIITEGDTFAVSVEGPNTESLRFVRDSEVIGITRSADWDGDTNATIRITMPAPREVTIAGSGTIRAASLAPTADVSIGGSGTVEFGRIAAEKLGINIGGTGTVKGAGTVKSLSIAIGGSGDVNMPGLKADNADIAIGGAGDVAFASDGEVTASIAGAGDINVVGDAKCTVSAFGSGTLNCVKATGAKAPALARPDAEAPQVPTAPAARPAPAPAQ